MLDLREKKLNKLANANNEIEQLVKEFTDKLNPIVKKELESKGIETDDYERNGFNAGAIALAMALGLPDDFDGNGLVAQELTNMILESINIISSNKEN